MRKITAFCLALVMTFTAFVCVNAETMAKPNVLYDYEKETLTISGIADENEGLTVYVVNPGYTKENIGETDEAMQNYRKITANAEGKYTYTLELSDAVKGEYQVYVKAKGKDAVSTVFTFADDTTIENLVSLLGEDDKAVIETAITNEDNVKYLQLNGFEPFINADKTELSAILADILKDETATGDATTDFVKVISLIRANSIVQIFNEGKSSIVTTGTVFLYEDDMGLTDLDENDRTIYSGYKSFLSEDAKKTVISAISNQAFASKEELLAKFAEETILNGVANPAEIGFEQVIGLLTSANCQYVSMTYKSLNNDQAAIIAMLPKQSSITNLQAEIAKILAGNGNGQGSVGGGAGGGGGGAAGGTVISGETSYLNGVGSLPVANTPKGSNYFDDLAGYEWADEAVGYLYQEKIVSGTGESTFAPGEKLTREQFAKVLCIVKGLDGIETDTFDDVAPGQWYAPYIGALSKEGLVNGVIDGTFGVGYSITREDLCVMLYRAFMDKIPAGTAKTFTDAVSVSDYAKEAVNAMSSAGILNGFTDGSFRPQENCTRAEMAKIIYEVSKLLD